MSEQRHEPGSSPDRSGGDQVGESLRTAVARTLAATAGSASDTGQRARDLLDEVARRGEVARAELGRRGAAARDEVVRRGEAAREGVSRRRDAARGDLARRSEEAASRLADAVSELKLADRDDWARLDRRLGALERRVGEIERRTGNEQRDAGREGSQAETNPEVDVESRRRDDHSEAGSDG